MNYALASRTLAVIAIIVITGLAFVKAQEVTPTLIPIDTSIVIPFPSLDCHDIQAPYIGSTWGEITVGLSTIEDLRNYVRELNPSYTEHSTVSLQWTSFSVSNGLSETENIPSVIGACVHSQDERILAISVIVATSSERIRVSELVAEYEKPDFVVWDEILSSRVLVWLTEGVAASVSVDKSEQFLPYGIVTRMVYFPYQTLEGYEERWPFTHRAAPRPEYVTLTPDLPHVTNPFDFDAMLATTTAEPIRTPTPMATESP